MVEGQKEQVQIELEKIPNNNVQPQPPNEPVEFNHKGSHPTPDGRPWYYRWIVLFISTVSILLVSVQQNALIVALPQVITSLGAELQTIIWTLLAFSITVASLTIAIGGLSDLFGRCRVYNFGFVLFVIGCLMCGLAKENGGGVDLVIYRVIQSIGATSIFSNSGAILTDAFFPYKRVGFAMGINQVVSAFGSILGPVLGGVMADVWRWIFMMNIPIGGITAIISLIFIRDKPTPPAIPPQNTVPQSVVVQPSNQNDNNNNTSPNNNNNNNNNNTVSNPGPQSDSTAVVNVNEVQNAQKLTTNVAADNNNITNNNNNSQPQPAAHAHHTLAYKLLHHFDWVGAFLITSTNACFLLALTTSAALHDFSVAAFVTLYALGAVCFVLFFVNENKFVTLWKIHKKPVLQFSLFEERNFLLANLGAFMAVLSRTIVLLISILYLQGPFGKDPYFAGICTIPLGLGILLSGTFAGIISDKIGRKLLQVSGPIISAAGALGLALFKNTSDYWGFAGALFIVGIGQGIYNSPNGASIMVKVPAKLRGVASGVRIWVSMLGSSIGMIAGFSIVIARLPLEALLVLFLYGEGDPSKLPAGTNLDTLNQTIASALSISYWLAFATILCSGIFSLFIPGAFIVKNSYAADAKS